MATHDYVIDNQSAPALRADLNNVLQAIVSQNSSATAPTTPYADMVWYDTANNQLKKRNEANSAWIILGTIDEINSKFTPNSWITTAEIAPATLVTAAETIAANNTDTHIPTSAAVKAYADSLGITDGSVTEIKLGTSAVARAKLKTGTNSGSYSTGSGGGFGVIILDAYSFFPSHNGNGSVGWASTGSVDAPRMAWSTSATGSGTVSWRYVRA